MDAALSSHLASKSSWGAVCNGYAASGFGWALGCLGILSPGVVDNTWALKGFGLGHDKRVLVGADNTVTVAYTRMVYATFTYHNSPAISCPGASGCGAPLTVRVTGSPEVSGGSTLRRSGCFRVDSARHRGSVSHRNPLIAVGYTA
ncbi:C2 domain-containing protein 3 [Labeo rohita]|uniref:C2 domain-containing protein 3 n=1 Tax=Labeo rohita TaxID=84645 RepID=A0ABQ8MJZ1_LABRO|nr:C2 domain-containing protein 3 [Labeo rohita]